MATSLANGQVLQVRHVVMLNNQVGQIIRNYRVNAVTLVAPNDLDAAAWLDGIAAPLIKALCTSGATYRGTGVQIIQPLPRLQEVHSTANQGPCVVAGGPLPTQTSGIISLYTNLAGRSGRGRVYVPFPSTNNLDANGHPDILYGPPLSNLAAYLIAGQTVPTLGGSANLVPVIYHRSTGGTTDLTMSVIHNKWATQRRRGDYGRTNVQPF